MKEISNNDDLDKPLDCNQKLDLSNTEIETLRADQFAMHPQLSKLNISNNKIHQIDMSIFDNMSELTQLNFTNNPISLFKSNIFMKYSKSINLTNEVQKFVVNIDTNSENLYINEFSNYVAVKKNDNLKVIQCTNFDLNVGSKR